MFSLGLSALNNTTHLTLGLVMLCYAHTGLFKSMWLIIQKQKL